MFAWLLQTACLHLKFRDSGSGQAPLKVPNPARELAQKTQHSGKQCWQSTTHPHRSTRDFPGEVTRVEAGIDGKCTGLWCPLEEEGVHRLEQGQQRAPGTAADTALLHCRSPER